MQDETKNELLLEAVWDTSGPLTYTTKNDITIKTWVDRDMCIGAATCIAVAPNTFNLDDEAKAIYLSSARKDSYETLLDSAMACPVAAIIIESADGKRLYPEE
jgi:ferredoxin